MFQHPGHSRPTANHTPGNYLHGTKARESTGGRVRSGSRVRMVLLIAYLDSRLFKLQHITFFTYEGYILRKFQNCETYNDSTRNFGTPRGDKICRPVRCCKRAGNSTRDDRNDVSVGLLRKSGKRSLYTWGLCGTDQLLH